VTDRPSAPGPGRPGPERAGPPAVNDEQRRWARSASPRLPEAAWAHAAASGRLDGVRWVEDRVEPEDGAAEPFSVDHDDEGAERFRGLVLEDYLPPAQVDAIRAADRRGFPSLLHGLKYALAEPAWLVRTRSSLWSPTSPRPLLLRSLIEAYGLGVELHRGEAEVLARLAARVHQWYPQRGHLGYARRLVDAAGLKTSSEDLLHREDSGPLPRTARDEVFAARAASWWGARQQPGAHQHLLIRDGLLRCQPTTGPGFALLQEDVLLSWQRPAQPPAASPPGAVQFADGWCSPPPLPSPSPSAAPAPAAPALDGSALRLLPAWTSLRVAAVENLG
jgi:hypothetical protein